MTLVSSSCIVQKRCSEESVRSVAQKCRSEVSIRSVSHRSEVLIRSVEQECRSEVLLRSGAQKSCSEVLSRSVAQKCRSEVLSRNVAQRCCQQCRSRVALRSVAHIARVGNMHIRKAIFCVRVPGAEGWEGPDGVCHKWIKDAPSTPETLQNLHRTPLQLSAFLGDPGSL